MSNIKELIQKHVDPHVFIKGYEGLEDAMKEYAETYVKKCLVEAARNVRILDDGRDTEQAYVVIDAYDHFKRDKEFRVDIDSILTLKLPEHE
jgi:hypothetical protein